MSTVTVMVRVRTRVKVRVRYAWFCIHGLYRQLSMDCTVLYRAIHRLSKSALYAQHIF